VFEPIGKEILNDRKNAVDDAAEVDFYKMIATETELPGISQLNIELFDKELIGNDELIGKTIIDLEDRWFDNRWQEWGKENIILPGNQAKNEGEGKTLSHSICHSTIILLISSFISSLLIANRG
jgi:hypothetical protein